MITEVPKILRLPCTNPQEIFTLQFVLQTIQQTRTVQTAEYAGAQNQRTVVFSDVPGCGAPVKNGASQGDLYAVLTAVTVESGLGPTQGYPNFKVGQTVYATIYNTDGYKGAWTCGGNNCGLQITVS